MMIMRKKSIVLAAAAFFAAIIILLVFLLFKNSHSAGYDFIDNFDRAVIKTGDGRDLTGERRAGADKDIEKRLMRRCSVLLPDHLREIISNNLSFGPVLLINKSSREDSAVDNGKGAFIMSIAVDYSASKGKAGDENPVYKTDIRMGAAGETYSIAMYNGNPVKITVFFKNADGEKIVDSFNIPVVNGTVRLYLYSVGNGFFLSSGYSLWSHFLLNPGEKPGQVRFNRVSKDSGSDVKAVRFKRLGKREEEELLSWIVQYNLWPEKDPARNYIIWNGLEFEDKPAGIVRTDAYLRRLMLQNVTMRAIVTGADDSVVFNDVEIPRGAVLEFAAAVQPDAYYGGKHVDFTVELSGCNGNPIKFIKKVEVDSEDVYKWHEAEFDLSQFEGKKLAIKFNVLKPSGAGGMDEGLVAWGNPVIRARSEKEGPNVILISLDTLRADHMGCFGYKRDTTPELDKWAKKGVFFKNSISNSSWTLPSHVSILASLYPGEAGIDVCENTEHIKRSRLAPGIPSIASFLRFEGYKTYAITGGGYMSAIFGFDRGFDIYKEYPERKDFKKDVNEALRFIKANRGKKFFLFLHTFEIHAPYRRNFYKTDSPEKKDSVIADYDSGIKYADNYFGHFIKGLKRLGVYDKTLIIVTSDHGEVFDHITKDINFGTHGHSLKEPLIRVPLIMGGLKEIETGKTVATVVSGVDILPTILDVLDIEYDAAAVRGLSLLPLINGDKFTERRAYSSNILGGKKDMDSLRSIKNKLILHRDTATGKYIASETEFYDIEKDPDETENLPSHSLKTLFEKEIEEIAREISVRKSMLKKFSSPRGRYRDLMNALNIGGYVSPAEY